MAAVAWVAARRGDDLWWLAIVVLALLAVRHAEDFAYATRHRALSARPVVPRALDVPGDGGAQGARTDVPAAPTGRARLVRDVKQVLHLPIAERYLVMSVGLLLYSPALLLWALGIASAIALSWTQAGRLARALTGRDGFRADRPGPRRCRTSRPRRRCRGRPGAGGSPGSCPACCSPSRRRPCCSPPAATRSPRAAAYAWLAAVCWHVYDNVYRLRETGRGTPHALVRATSRASRAASSSSRSSAAAPTGPGRRAARRRGRCSLVLYAAESARAGWRRRPSGGRRCGSGRVDRQDGARDARPGTTRATTTRPSPSCAPSPSRPSTSPATTPSTGPARSTSGTSRSTRRAPCCRRTSRPTASPG